MSISPIKEINLFQEIATAIGGTLEDVCNLQDQERKDLMTVLGLQDVNYNENYQLDSPSSRTRSATKKEVVDKRVTVSTSTEHVGKGKAHEIKSKVVATFIICEVMDEVFKVSSNETLDMKDNTVIVRNCIKLDNENNMMNELSSTTVSIEANRTKPSTSNNNTGTDKSARGQINKLTRRKKGGKYNSTAQTVLKKVQISPKFTTNITIPSFNSNQIKDVLLQRLYPEYLGSQEPSSWCTKYGIHHNILNTDHPPVEAVLDSQEPVLPLLTSERIVNTKCWKKKEGIAELYKLHEVITEMKRKGMVHGRISREQEWIKLLQQPVNEKSGMGDSDKLPLRRSQRKGKMSRTTDDTDFVYGDFIMSSEEEESLTRGRETKVVEVVTRTPVEDNESVTSMSGEGSFEKERKGGRKRKLFDSRSNFMSDSPGLESVREDMRNLEEGQDKRKSRRSRNSLNRTVKMLKQEGSLTDLCK